MATKQIDNPDGAFGLTATKGGQVVASYAASSTATIKAGRVVAVDASGKIAEAATNAAQVACIGVAVKDIVAAGGVAGKGPVCVHGVVTGVPYTGTDPVFGDLLTRSTATAGAVMTQSATGASQIGTWLGFCAGGVDTVAKVCDVFVTKL